jgi:hypothetical protein
MNWWATVARSFPGNRRKSYEAQKLLTDSYRAVFMGKGSSLEQRQIVLSDLQAQTNWNRVLDPRTATDREVWFQEGMRAAYGVIFAHLSLSDADVEALNNAARLEAALRDVDNAAN